MMTETRNTLVLTGKDEEWLPEFRPTPESLGIGCAAAVMNRRGIGVFKTEDGRCFDTRTTVHFLRGPNGTMLRGKPIAITRFPYILDPDTVPLEWVTVPKDSAE